MTHDLKPYPKYKNSGLPWLGRIPAHWEVKKAKHIFRCIDVRSETGNEQLLTVSSERGVVPRSSIKVTMFKAESYMGYKLCWPGDLVINSLWAWAGGLGVSKNHGIISSAYGVYRLRNDFEGYTEFIHHLVRSVAFHWELRVRSKGIWISRLQLTDDAFLGTPIPLPPATEARSISHFIATIDQRINRFIRNRQQLIKVLNEQKQAIISRAVTRGLDPNVKLKPSGVEWLGEIPEHWEKRRLKTIADVVLGKMLKTSPSKGDELKPYLRSANIQWFEPNISNVASMWFSQSEMKQYRIAKDDILVSEGGEVGRACIWHNELDECYIQNSVHKITARSEILPLFLLYQFSAFSNKGTFKAIVNRVSIAHLTREKLVAVSFCKPPIEEQKNIIAHIQEKSAEIDKAIANAQREINLIREYRTRLIADVVTGKVDVRGITAEKKKTARVIQFPKKEEAARPKANVHFRRAVFATEIVARLHKEPTFGHVKFQKLIFLCEKKCGVDIGSTYYRQAAGPYDNRAFRSIDSQMKKQQWFAAMKVDKRYIYVPLPKAGGHKTYFDRYFPDVEKRFSAVIETFRKLDTEQCEIVATLYSAWEDLLKENKPVSDERIVNEVLNNWHVSKKRISRERWENALNWMRQHGFVPGPMRQRRETS